MARGQRICVACGTSYKYCPNCAEDQDKPTWMFAWHDLECKTVWNIICKYKNGSLNKEDAMKQLNETISHKIKFTDDIESDIAEICAVKKEELPREEIPVILGPVIVEEPIEETVLPKRTYKNKSKKIVTEN